MPPYHLDLNTVMTQACILYTNRPGDIELMNLIRAG